MYAWNDMVLLSCCPSNSLGTRAPGAFVSAQLVLLDGNSWRLGTKAPSQARLQNLRRFNDFHHAIEQLEQGSQDEPGRPAVMYKGIIAGYNPRRCTGRSAFAS
jgi:hypothetical protein